MSTRARSLLLALVAALLGCQSTDRTGGDVPPASLEELRGWMVGAYSTADQAARWPSDFLDVRMYMTPIWTGRTDGPWLYVEQSAANAPETPYRQRVYHLVVEGSGLRSDVYELPGAPLVYAGAWRDPARFDVLRPSLLIEREGCAIHLRRTDNAYVGSTRDKGCPSVLRGALYSSSVVNITVGGMSSWDRGFDAEGKQVWGSTAGAYEFVKLPDAG